MVVSQDKP